MTPRGLLPPAQLARLLRAAPEQCLKEIDRYIAHAKTPATQAIWQEVRNLVARRISKKDPP